MRYPLGIQDFRKLRTGGFAYVDKTAPLCRIADGSGYYFLARPRRFGKSLAISTLAELYSGDRELFRGLWAHDHWDFAAKHSAVIWIKFASSGFGEQGLERAIHGMIDREAARLGIEIGPGYEVGTAERFRSLIEGAAAVSPSGRAVVLIDEYDKPIVDYLERDDDMAQAEANRELLRWFYSPLKDADPFLELVFITGITVFSKVSLFSEVNNLVNLSLQPLAATVVGLTQSELDEAFGERLDELGADRGEVRRFYNGYAFSPGAETVYNPWSVLNYLYGGGRFVSYWLASSTPFWVTRMMAVRGITDPEARTMSEQRLMSFDLRDLDPIAILYQTGYLTLAGETVTGNLRFRFPNLEVRRAFEASLLGGFLREDSTTRASEANEVAEALLEGDLGAVVRYLDATLAEVPYHLWEAHRESAYHMIAHVLLRAANAALKSEVATSKGRADMLVTTPTTVYCFEFKVGASAQAALAQVREKGYLEAYAAGDRERVAVGVNFDPERRQVGEWWATEVYGG